MHNTPYDERKPCDMTREVEISSKTLCDKYGRKLNSLRISVTQRCNLQCFFCHREGQTAPNGEMSSGEIVQIANVASQLGMKKVKLTGGEPLLRQDIAKIVSEIAQYADEVSLTTNGVLLEKHAQALYDAGLKRVNVSLSSITSENFRKITGKPCIQQVKNGIRAALQSGLYPVKINVVMLKGINTGEIPKMVDFAKEVGAALQLIEFQPVPRENMIYWSNFHCDLAPIENWLRNKAVAIEENPLHKRKRYVLKRNGGFVWVEIVRPMHNSSFCQNCTRLRVTSDGKLKPCLLRNDNLVDVVPLLRRGAAISELKEAFKKAVTLREPYWEEGEKNAHN
jgi:cyclic pyranopterin phosphate synthase